MYCCKVPLPISGTIKEIVNWGGEGFGPLFCGKKSSYMDDFGVVGKDVHTSLIPLHAVAALKLSKLFTVSSQVREMQLKCSFLTTSMYWDPKM